MVKNTQVSIYKIITTTCVFLVFAFAKAQQTGTPVDTTKTARLGRLTLKDPASIATLYTYDPVLDRYVYSSVFQGYNIDYPYILSREEYTKRFMQEQRQAYFRDKYKALAGKTEEDKKKQKNLLPNFYVNSAVFESIFGGTEISVIPQGSVEVDLGLLFNRSDNPSFSPRNRQNLTFDFNQRINLSLQGKVGTRLNVNANYDTQSTFNFQNQIKLDYTPTEDDILQSIEVGNVSFPLNTRLIRGPQSLFGVKADLQFGKTKITTVFAEQQSESRTVQAAGGASINEFDFQSLDYDENRHFFLAHYFRDTYDRALANYPFRNTNVQITRAEVWITNRGNRTQDVRNLVAIQDIGESDPTNIGLDAQPAGFINAAPGAFPDNENNDFNPFGINRPGESILTEQIRDIATTQQGFGGAQVNEGFDYVTLENARQLTQNEYSINTELGYISLRQRLNNDEVLAVAFQFISGGQTYQVGEFANDGVVATDVIASPDPNNPPVSNQNLVVKLLKSNLTNVAEPIWDLMMKNIYNLGGSQLSQEDFRLNIFYQFPPELNYITAAEGSLTNPPVPLPADVEQTTLIKVFNLDRLNKQGDPQNDGDGFFDYIPGTTIDEQNGRIIFTSVEPFGNYLFDKLDNTPGAGTENYEDPTTYNANQAKYVYRDMYNTTKAQALQSPELNRYLIRGTYKATGQEGIPIGAFNVPRGSVVVTAGGRTLQEGLDYSVDYLSGRVIILDQALLNSNTPIQVSTESNSIFNQQVKRFTGLNIEHKFSEKFILGGSYLGLKERPVTQKAQIGSEPINNTIVGANFLYNTEVPFLTRLANKLPNIDTDIPSNLSMRGEIAYLFPNASNGADFDGQAAAYVDDFEGSQTSIDILSPFAWSLASVPIRFEGLGTDTNRLAYNYNRARLAWYFIDPIFYGVGNQRPPGITNDDVSDYRSRRVFVNEIFPNVDLQQGQQQVINTLDLSYFPNERGPYNFNPATTAANTIPNPRDNWAGIMRQFSSTDFEQTNVEYFQFWVMDPFPYDPTNDGGLVTIDIGSISEDILKDNRKQYENGLPNDGGTNLTIPTAYGKVPANQSLVYAFDTGGQERVNQDIGLDGLSDDEERVQFPGFDPIDPAGDNYEYFAQASGDIPNRYKRYNNTQGNSPTEVSQDNRGSTTLPDVEDINRDNTMNTIDSYFSYNVPMFPGMDSGNNPYIFDETNVQTTLPNGNTIDTRWVQFRVPLNDVTREVIGNIADFRAIRFMRMTVTDFEVDTYLRFATLDLVRGDYRRYLASLQDTDPNPNDDGTTFDIESVDITNNATRVPIPYVLPPGVIREQLRTQNQNIRQNEQSLALRVQDLQPQDARGVFKNLRIDMRQYENLQMFVHAEAISNELEPLEDELEAFIRMGLDFTDNYYEIRVPLKLTAFNSTAPNAIWPEDNEFDIKLALLQEIKARVLGDPSLVVSELNLFDQADLDPSSASRPNQQQYGIKGNPNFGDIRSMMLGIRNASDKNGFGEVWFNELRLSGLKNQGGYAADLSVDVNMADFITLTANGQRSTIGFGALEQGPNERSREDVTQFDIATSANLGQLLPKDWGIRLPASYSYGQQTVTPQFDPQFEDIELQTRLDNAASDADRRAIREQSENFTRRQSYNLIGVKKDRTGTRKPLPIDIENFTFSGSYNQTDQRNFEIENYKQQLVNVGAVYNYAFPKGTIEPFKKTKAFEKSKYFDAIKELNINLLPNNLTASSNIIRQFDTQKFRDLQLDTNPVDLNGDGIPDARNISIAPLTNRNFNLQNRYAINWDLTRSFQFNFSANNDRIVRSYLDADNNVDETYEIFTGFFDEGVANRHSQQLQATYKLPLEKIPFFAFAKANYTYTSDFLWQRGSLQFQQLDGIPNLGNNVSNSNTHRINGTLELDKFYKYVGLEKIKYGVRPGANPRSRNNTTRSRIPTPEVPELDNDNKKEKKPKEKKIPEKSFGNDAYNTFVGIVTSIKRATINYDETNGTFLPGYLEDVGFLGTLNPSAGFTFGSQNDIRYEAARRGWLTLFDQFNQQYTQQNTKKLDYTLKVDLLKDLTIDVLGNRTIQENDIENYIVDPITLQYNPLSPRSNGNFTISTLSIGTAFANTSIEESVNFDTFRDNRLVVAERLARDFYGNDTYARDVNGYPLGFSRNSQNVLLPSFIAAYEGRDINKQDDSPFRNIPLPNWNIKYTGLMNLKYFKDKFKRFSLNHGYRSNFTINQFQNNLDFSAPFLNTDYVAQPAEAINQNGDFKPRNLFFNVNITEFFSPLIKVDMEFKNSLSVAAEWKKDRAISLSFDNNLLTEINGNEVIVGLGYRIRDVKFNTSVGGVSNVLKSDINLRLDGSIRDNVTIVRYLDLENSQATAGQTIVGAKLTAEYALSRAFTAIFYYDHTFSKFAISTAFPQTTVRSGFTLRYTFGN